MAFLSTLGSVLGGVGTLAGGISSLFGGDSGGGSTSAAQGTTTTRTPAAWEPGMQQIWANYLGKLYGKSETQDKIAELNSQLNKNLNNIAHWQWRMQKSGDPGKYQRRITDARMENSEIESQIQELMSSEDTGEVEVPSYSQRLEEDIEYKRNAFDTYVDELQGISDDLVDALAQITQDYTTSQQELAGELANREQIDTLRQQYTKPYTISLAGRPMQIVPRHQLRALEASLNAEDMLRKNIIERSGISEGVYNKALADAMLKSQTGEKTSGLNLALAEQYAPNRAYFEYTDYLQPLALQMQQLRYGTPTTATSETGSISRTPSFWETAGNAAELGSSFANLLNTFINSQKTPTTDTSATTEEYDPYSGLLYT
jgi:hypothetical protein